MKLQKPFFLASNNANAQKKKENLEKKFGNNSTDNADVIVVLGGDGFMLEAIKNQDDDDDPDPDSPTPMSAYGQADKRKVS